MSVTAYVSMYYFSCPLVIPVHVLFSQFPPTLHSPMHPFFLPSTLTIPENELPSKTRARQSRTIAKFCPWTVCIYSRLVKQTPVYGALLDTLNIQLHRVTLTGNNIHTRNCQQHFREH